MCVKCSPTTVTEYNSSYCVSVSLCWSGRWPAKYWTLRCVAADWVQGVNVGEKNLQFEFVFVSIKACRQSEKSESSCGNSRFLFHWRDTLFCLAVWIIHNVTCASQHFHNNDNISWGGQMLSQRQRQQKCHFGDAKDFCCIATVRPSDLLRHLSLFPPVDLFALWLKAAHSSAVAACLADLLAAQEGFA